MKQFCMFCLKDMHRQYPGNDPENGPAVFTCGYWNCDAMRDEEKADNYYFFTAPIDYLHEEALEDDHIYEMYEKEQFLVGVVHAERMAGWDQNP